MGHSTFYDLGIEEKDNAYIDFSDHVRCVPRLNHIEIILSPQINIAGIYAIGLHVPFLPAIKSIDKDWYYQSTKPEEVKELLL
ncbi:MAG: hypothetical protein QXL94_05530 [Candidatus Parvarchaeum sp.]